MFGSPSFEMKCFYLIEKDWKEILNDVFNSLGLWKYVDPRACQNEEEIIDGSELEKRYNG